MRALILLAALALSGCATAQTSSAGTIPTTLPSTVLLDDKAGVAVETAYQAAALAERTAVQAGFVTPSQAARLMVLDNEAYTYVCYTRTAYDLGNGIDPSKRADDCPANTRGGAIPSYVDAGRAALAIIQEMVAEVGSFQRASGANL